MFGEFKVFNVYFDETPKGRYSKERIQARSVIRGCLMFNDLDLVDDPWDYNLKKNR